MAGLIWCLVAGFASGVSLFATLWAWRQALKWRRLWLALSAEALRLHREMARLRHERRIDQLIHSAWSDRHED